jgi:hypothetical protein
VESSGNQYAIRFEPATFQAAPAWIMKQVSRIQYAHGKIGAMDAQTALAVGCTSYGLYQILGANIYSGVYAKPFWQFMENVADQQAAFQEFISPHGFDPTEDVSEWADSRFAAFATFYNGPGAVDDYVAMMKSHM